MKKSFILNHFKSLRDTYLFYVKNKPFVSFVNYSKIDLFQLNNFVAIKTTRLS